MKSKQKIVFLILTLFLSSALFLTACKPQAGGGVDPTRFIDADSLEILGTQTVLTPGEYVFEAKVKPVNSDQGVKWDLVGIPKGVAFGGEKGNVLSVAGNAENGSKIRVKATSTYDRSIFTHRYYTLSIPEIQGTPISTEAELRAIDTDDETRRGSYILTNDITLTSDWEPLGTSEKEDDTGVIIREAQPFNGVLNGNGYSIKGINVDKFEDTENGQVIGFIEQIGGTGEVKNLGLEGKIKAHSWSGGICAINNGTISNVRSAIELETKGGAAGALVSINSGRVQYSFAIGKVVSGNKNTGARSAGLFVNAGDAASCFGDVEAMTTENYQTNTGAIKKPEVMLSTALMQTATTYADYNKDIWYIPNGEYPQLKNPDFVGAEEKPFVAITNKEEFIAVYDEYDFQITAQIAGVADKSAIFSLKNAVAGVDLNAQTGLLTFDKAVVEDYTDLTVVATLTENSEVKAEKTFKLLNDDFDETNTYTVKNEDQLYRLTQETRFLDGIIQLANNIRLEKYADWPGIGTVEPFTGTFKGNGYTISGLNATGTTGGYGFFKTVEGKTNSQVVIERLKLTGSVSGSPSWAGTMIGSLNRGVVENCMTDVDISTDTGLRVGGFAGVNSQEGSPNSTIRNCVSVGKVTTGADQATAGGFAAANNATMQHCFVDMVASGSTKITSFGDVDSCLLLNDVEMRTAATFTEVQLSDTYWYKADNSYPMLKTDDFTAPPAEVYLYIADPGVIDLTDADTYQLQAKKLPAVDVSAKFEMKSAVTGVSVTETGLLSFADTYVIGTAFTVVATYAENDSIVAERTLNTTSMAPIAISTEEELYALTQPGADLTRSYYLANDIALVQYKAWPGITRTFSGLFDGKGYAITGLDSVKGLFSTLEAADKDTVIIKNLKVQGKFRPNSGWSGVLGTWFNKGIIENIILDVDIDAATVTGAIGVIVGCNSQEGQNLSTIRNSVVLGKIGEVLPSGWMQKLGAIAGANNGTITNVFYDSELTGANASFANGTTHPGSDKTTAQMKEANTYAAFSTEIWNIQEGSYPALKNGNN